MAFLLFIIITFTKILGFCSVETVGHLITAHSGGSITIPCFYGDQYRDHVKYWCKGDLWASCTIMARTDSHHSSNKVSITDYPDRLFFTVNMTELSWYDINKYWCAVEIGGTGTVDDSVPLFLKVNTGTKSISTASWFAADTGGSVTVPCHYGQEYRHHVKYWCKGTRWDLCSTVVRTDTPHTTGNVSITDNPAHLVFTVTMRNLQEEDSGIYWCAVEINRAADYGAFLTLLVRKGMSGVCSSCNNDQSLWPPSDPVPSIQHRIPTSISTRWSWEKNPTEQCMEKSPAGDITLGWTSSTHDLTSLTPGAPTSIPTMETSCSTLLLSTNALLVLLFALGVLVASSVLICSLIYTHKKNEDRNRSVADTHPAPNDTPEPEVVYRAVACKTAEPSEKNSTDPELIYSMVKQRQDGLNSD